MLAKSLEAEAVLLLAIVNPTPPCFGRPICGVDDLWIDKTAPRSLERRN